MTFHHIRALLVNAYRERYGEDENYVILKKLMKKAAKIEDDRNTITHSFWAAGKEKKKYYQDENYS